jgi:hypothetical protein
VNGECGLQRLNQDIGDILTGGYGRIPCGNRAVVASRWSRIRVSTLTGFHPLRGAHRALSMPWRTDEDDAAVKALAAAGFTVRGTVEGRAHSVHTRQAPTMRRLSIMASERVGT